MISDKVALTIKKAAQAYGIEPAALLALVEVETGGKLFEQDGRTPQFLFERHVCWKEASKAGCLDAFKAAGLAIPHWDRATQYRDQRTSAERLSLIAAARFIDEEVANRSASFGLFQTMGFLAEGLGFASATEMVAHQTGSMDGQIDCGLRELHKSHLIEPLNSHDWQHVARTYNGEGYAANHYDTRLADAWKRWSRKVDSIPTVTPPEQSLSREEIRQVQSRLDQLGYHEVGIPDGAWGSRTAGALSAFQAHEGLTVTGHYDNATRDALNIAANRPVAPEREQTDAGELKDAGSRTVEHADSLSLWGKLLKWLGIGGAGTAGADQSGLLDQAKGAVDQVGDLKGLFESASDIGAWMLAHWWIGAIIAGAVIAYRAEQIIAARLEDHRTGRHAGPQGV